MIRNLWIGGLANDYEEKILTAINAYMVGKTSTVRFHFSFCQDGLRSMD